jgi:hypothetical protein
LGFNDLSCLLKTMYNLLDYPTIGRRARDAAAKAIVRMLATSTTGEGEGDALEQDKDLNITFEEFLALPDVQPDVLKMISFNLPFASQRSAKKSAKRATGAAMEAAAAVAAVAATTTTFERRSSVDEVQQLKTSPRM